VFYMDRMITIEKDDEGDWDDLFPVSQCRFEQRKL